MPSSPHHKVFRAPQCYTDKQTLPATRSIIFTLNNKTKHVTVVFNPPIIVVVWVQKGHRQAQCLSGSCCSWQGRKTAFPHAALPWASVVTLSKSRLVSSEKGNCRYFFSFPWAGLICALGCKIYFKKCVSSMKKKMFPRKADLKIPRSKNGKV